jgi:ankyrin repeat protein
MSKATKALVKIVEKSASETNSCEQAQQLIREGADIKALTSNGPMIHAVIAEEKRQRQSIPLKADNCLRLIKVLEKAASDRLSAQVFSGNGADLQEMHLLMSLKASCYQPETYGPLGLLGSILNQDKVPIRIDVLKFLIESDPNAKSALIIINAQGQTCLTLAKTNPKCPKDVIEYLQQHLDEIVNQIPFTQPRINPNQVIMWIRSGANIEATDKNGNTILSNAARANNLELVHALVSSGSDITHKNNDGLTPVEIAKKTIPRNPQLISYLNGHGMNVELKRLIETKKSALTIDEVQTLLENGANINVSMTNGDSPLHILILNQGTPDMVKAFINDFNADLSATNSKGYRAIETCILIDKEPYPYLQTLLPLPKMTEDKFRNPKLNKTLIQFSIEQKCSGAVKLIQDELNLRLWNCIARANTNEYNNKTIIDAANQLIASGAQINHQHTDQEYDKWTVLHLATKATTVGMLQYMIQYMQADYTLQNGNGDYPISIAAQFGHLPMVEYLHSLPKSSLNVCNKEMQTPLHLATKIIISSLFDISSNGVPTIKLRINRNKRH